MLNPQAAASTGHLFPFPWGGKGSGRRGRGSAFLRSLIRFPSPRLGRDTQVALEAVIITFVQKYLGGRSQTCRGEKYVLDCQIFFDGGGTTIDFYDQPL